MPCLATLARYVEMGFLARFSRVLPKPQESIMAHTARIQQNSPKLWPHGKKRGGKKNPINPPRGPGYGPRINRPLRLDAVEEPRS